MSKKALYNLIRMNHGTSTFALPSGISLADTEDKKGARYFKFELPIAKRIHIDDLLLSSHHVSVYESPTGKIDLKSQYHYTAYFYNAAGKKYRLHAFFDSRDFLVSSPMLSVLKEGTVDTYEPVASEDLDEIFTHLAITSCSELVAFLRAAQKNKADALQLQFNELENRMEPLSDDLVTNKSECLNIITRQISILDELSNISNRAADIIKQMRWLSTSRDIIESGSFQSESVQDSEKEADSDKKAEKIPAAVVHKDKQGKKGNAKKAPPKAQPEISADIAELKAHFIQATKLVGVEKANLLSELYATLKDYEWKVQFKECTATIKDLSDLRFLRVSIEKSAGALLQSYLLQSEFKSAKLLNQFHHLLPDNMLLFALQSNRHQLLDFLLQHNLVAVNLNNITIKNVAYSSLVDYFFNGPGTDESKIACLDVLVKRGVSLMNIDNKTSLPFAALLLAQANHPLRAVLEKNPELTLHSVDFHRRMNQVLRTLFHSSVPIDVNELISNNERTITLLRQRISPYQQHDKQLELSLGHELAHQIENDPEISHQSARIFKKAALLMARKSDASFKSSMAAVTNIHSDLLVISVNELQSFEYLPPFEDLKREAVRLQLAIVEYYKLVNETLDLASVDMRTKKPKERKEILNHAKQIDMRIIELRKIMYHGYEDVMAQHRQKIIEAKKRVEVRNAELLRAIQEKNEAEAKANVLRQEIDLKKAELVALSQSIASEANALRQEIELKGAELRALSQSIASDGAISPNMDKDDTNKGSILTKAIAHTLFASHFASQASPVLSDSPAPDDGDEEYVSEDEFEAVSGGPGSTS